MNIKKLIVYINQFDANKNLYIGGHGDIKCIGNKEYYYHSGGAGFILSKECVYNIYLYLNNMFSDWVNVCNNINNNYNCEYLISACDVAISYFLQNKLQLNLEIIKNNEAFFGCNYKGLCYNNTFGCCDKKINIDNIISCHNMTLSDSDEYTKVLNKNLSNYALDDIEFTTDVLYDNITKTFTSNYITTSQQADITIIEEPVIIMHSLDACYSHALLDRCYPIFWIITDLIKNNIIKNNKVRLFILEKSIKENPGQFTPWLLINDVDKKYNNVWHDIISLITPYEILFQHLLDKKYIFKQYFKTPYHDYWQRSPWNSIDCYPGRNIHIKDVRFNDDIIYNKLSLFKKHIFDYIGLKEVDLMHHNNLIIIDRKYSRKFSRDVFHKLMIEANKNISCKFK